MANNQVSADIIVGTSVSSNVVAGGAGPQGPQGGQGPQGIQGIQGNPGVVTSVNGYSTASITLVKGDVGLGNVDNTSDATKNSASATLTNKTISTGSTIDANVVVTEVLNKVYPVGSIYISAVSTSPATLFGFGTWVPYAEGRTMVGKAPSGTFVTNGATGGAETHTLTVAELPATLPYKNASTNGVILDWAGPANNYGMQAGSGSFGSVGGYTFRNYLDATWNGGGAAHNNLQPYIVTYMWKRTA
jgi:hypothetical protein